MFNELLNEKLINKGATFVGFANLDVVPTVIRRNFSYGVLIAKALNPQIVSRIPTGPHMEYYYEYKYTSDQLNDLCEFAASLIIEKGYQAYPQSRRHVKQDLNWRTPLPHKTVATLAGIGWIGKSAALVTDSYGGAIRITTILTDMPFLTGIPVKESKCGTCTICTNQCPGKAVKGRNWQTGIDRDELLDPEACKGTVVKRGETFGLTEGTCGLCIAMCPYTQQYIANSIPSYKTYSEK